MPPRSSAPRPPLTHFLCLPLANTTSRLQLAENLAAFRADVTSPASHGIPADAVRPVGTLHLTLGVMSLKDEKLEKAIELLKSLKPEGILSTTETPTIPGVPPQPKPSEEEEEGVQKPSIADILSLKLQGLHSMQDPRKATVLYASPSDRNGVLQQFCEKLRAPFLDAGFMIKDNRPLLLHATIVNTIYAKSRVKGKPHGSRLTIDARDIIDRYGDQVWANHINLTKLAICKMGAKEVEVAGVVDVAYEVEAEVDL